MMTHNEIRRRFLGALFTAFALLACFDPRLEAQFSGPAVGVTPQGVVQDPSVASPDYRDSTISAGDLLTIRILGVPEFAPPVRVSVDGTVQLPLIGLVRVAGLTIDGAENLIAERLVSAQMYRNPQVTIQTTESTGQSATVSGEMHAIVPLQGNRRLFDVLAAAGNLPVTASHVITILRPGVAKPITVDLGTDPSLSASANIQILPHDTILVSRVGVVYVLGAFGRQGTIPLDQNAPLTLMEVTALSGGENFEGRFKDLRIIRTEGNQRKIITTDIKAVLNGRLPDPILQANDIVFLPTNNFKAIIKSQGVGTFLSIISFLVIALER